MKLFTIFACLLFVSSSFASGIQCIGKTTKEKFLFYSTDSSYELLHIKTKNGMDQIISKMNNADFELGSKSEGSFKDVTEVKSSNLTKGMNYKLLPKKGIVSISSKKGGVTQRITDLNCKII